MTIKLPARYEFSGVSKGGGMGDIHHCTDTHLSRPVILKMLKEGEESRRLLDEQKALIKLRSKHVVQLYDVISVEIDSVPQTALVLEHISGHDLKVGSFKPDTVFLKTMWQVACGLADIHQANVIHRDIKPNNIRVDAEGVVKILDFGLARSGGPEAQTRSIIGTPIFMAPELWASATISFDKKIDVYAFAVMALTLINPSNIPRELMDRPPQPVPPGTLVHYLGGVPSDVINILEHCLSSTPSERPSMTEIEACLRRHLLYNRHRGLLILDGQTYEVNATTQIVNLRSGATEAIGISYDGLRFTVSSVAGTVLINNVSVVVGQELPGCCVIGFGPRNTFRNFVTFDVSNPEVMP